jgi:hypothetical protein
MAQANAGDLLQKMAQSGERAGGGHGGDRKSNPPLSLEKLGVSPKDSSRWQNANIRGASGHRSRQTRGSN